MTTSRVFKRSGFTSRAKWTDYPGLICFNNAFLAWLGYHSPLAGFAHWLLYLFREPFYEYDKEKTKLRKTGESSFRAWPCFPVLSAAS